MAHDIQKKNISFDEVVLLLRKLAQQYKNAKFDIIASVGRGGLVPARILSELLAVKHICILDVSAYDGQFFGELQYDTSIEAKKHFQNILEGKKVLIVDDCLTTGASMEFSRSYIQSCKPKSIDMAVLFMNKHCFFSHIEYAKKYNGENTWIVFPWEELTTKKGINDK